CAAGASRRISPAWRSTWPPTPPASTPPTASWSTAGTRCSDMALRTPLCDLLGVEHPILLAGMGGVSYAELAAAVSNAGGYGVLGMAGTSPGFIEDQMKKVR